MATFFIIMFILVALMFWYRDRLSEFFLGFGMVGVVIFYILAAVVSLCWPLLIIWFLWRIAVKLAIV
jgi:hypothetical protein